MEGLFWNCIYNYKNQLYFENYSLDNIVITDGIKTIFECSKANINGCTYNGEKLWVSIAGSNELISIDSQKREYVIPILSYNAVRILKMVTGQKNLIVIEGIKGEKTEIFLLDAIEGCVRCLLPIETGYIDFVIESDQKGFLLCKEIKDVPQRYSDELPDTKILFFAELTWTNRKIQADIVRSIRLYADNNYDYGQTLMCDTPLRFPLFDNYLYYCPEQKSFSTYRKYVVYFSEDIKGIIIANPIGGKIFRVISLPSEMADSNFGYFYNEYSSELIIVSSAKDIRRYIVGCISEEAINNLNHTYDEALLNNIDLIANRNTGDMSFTNILYRAMNSCTCEPVGFSSKLKHNTDSKMGKIIILSGPSAAGKGSVVDTLVAENENYKIAVPATTRKCRDGEIPGESYVFLTVAEFEKGIQEGCFIEYDQYAGNYYGTLKEPVYSELKQGKNIILGVDFERALQIKKQNKDTLLVYIMPPDAKTAIERLSVREMDNEKVRSRLVVYAREAYSALRGDILLINNDTRTTAHILASLVDNPERAEEIYEENVELVVELKKEIERYLKPAVNDEKEFADIEIFRMIKEYFERSEKMLGDIKKTGQRQEKILGDINSKVTSLVHFVETDLQTWIASNRPGVADENLIEQFVHKAVDYINAHVQASNQKVQEEEIRLQKIFGNTWNKLLPTTQTSLVSASVLWELCDNISTVDFDYSGIIITVTAALESELKRVFYIDFQKYMVATYGDPAKQDAERTYAVWPERLLSKTKYRYDDEMSRGIASLPQLADNFTMGTLPYMFYDGNTNQKNILQNRMEEYLKTIVDKRYYKAPLNAFNEYSNDNNFVKQCENIRILYRNPAGHVDVMSRESAEKCYTKIVGVGKDNICQVNSEIRGLIMTLYSYLK